MPVSTLCSCGAQIEAPDDLAGQSVKCPQCAAVVAIPGGEPAAHRAENGQVHADQKEPVRHENVSQDSLVPVVGKAPVRAENYREDGDIPADLKEKALAEVAPNEKLVWMGQPLTDIVFRRNLGYIVIGGIIALIGLFWFMSGGLKVAGPPGPNMQPPARTFGSFGLILLIGGLCFTVVPLYHWKKAQGTCYALTTRRALVYKQGLFGPTRESYSPMEVTAMRRADSWVFQSGGDLIFRSVTVVSNSYSRGRHSSSVTTTYYGFLAIAHVQEVEKLVRETLIDRFVDKLTQANAL
jgi:hypothetical protein